jgi:DNA-binding CsgD family transcriptional regulator/PAS domain-containing protein
VASADDVLALVPMIYDAAVAPSQWQPFLEQLNARLDGATTVLHLQRIAGHQSGQVMAAVGVSDSDQRRYDEYYASTNIWTIRGRDRLQQGAVLTGEDVCTNRELERSEYYNDYLKGLGFYHALASVPSADANTTLIVSTLRTRARGAYEPEAVQLQRNLTPHLQRAAQVYDRLASAELQARAFGDALERMPIGVVLLDLRHRALFANAAARAIAAARDGFTLAADGPAGASPAETARLRRVIASAIAATTTVDSRGGGCLLLQRPSGRKPYDLLVGPLASNADADAGHGAVVILFITDPEDETPADPALLRELYGLTRSEARLATEMLGGATLADTAERLQVTLHTARWTLKQILQKTESRTQGQVIARLMKGLARLKEP